MPGSKVHNSLIMGANHHDMRGEDNRVGEPPPRPRRPRAPASTRIPREDPAVVWFEPDAAGEGARARREAFATEEEAEESLVPLAWLWREHAAR